MRRHLLILTLLAVPVAYVSGLVFFSKPKPVLALASNPIPADLPDFEYTLPDDELVPGAVSLIQEAGDVRDWGLDAIGVPEAWKLSKGKGVKVAVLDTGIDLQHRDLKDQVLIAKDFTGSASGTADVQGHGSFCAAQVAGAENGVGMVGVAPEAKLVIAKVLGDRGSGLGSWIAAGVDWAIEQKVNVISLSLGSKGIDPRIEAAIKRALDAGIIVIAAAGNDGPREGTVGYPGGQNGVICVAAVDSDLKVAGFSSRGSQVMVAAPGVNIRSAYPGDRFAVMSGTSMATPYTAGVAALYVANCRERGVKPSVSDFVKAIQTTSKDLPPQGRDTATGFGLIQPSKIVIPAPTLPPPKEVFDRIVIEIPPEFQNRKLRRVFLDFEPANKE